ncbi:KAP family P-loop NTPase fold protein [Flagellimonas meridianipacifica]|uniref:KAP-like P-loop domain-containing protein n=1 Tax=Flagellimonas meridianipacifica TaxID=1080225 RepID=A0A2T0MA63_9FLAO|nr:P-loop NTPase fold protein [Allomuricauda pacifica]PRX54404.1 KAP-like P-loop domain-containing protein [Allomuricauda pacifica]
MHIKHSEIQVPIDGTDPYINCKLDRKHLGEGLLEIIRAYNSGFVLAIDNEWGTGKTTFVKMWRQSLVNENYTTIYFNAWENDFQNEVIYVLLAELNNLKGSGEEKFSKVLENALPLLKRLFPLVLKHALSKAVGDDAIASVAESFGDYSIEELRKGLDSYKDQKKAIDSFKTSLQEYITEIDSDKPIIFIIDELDRCRPSYAVEVLERIKHIFDIPQVVFVLSIDKVQLGNAIKGAYGSESIDSNEYLRRFIDIEFRLPNPNISNFTRHLIDYFQIDTFFKSPERGQYRGFEYDSENFYKICLLIFENFKLSLRQIEKILGHVSIVIKTFRENHYVFPAPLLLLTYINLTHKKIYDEILEKRYSLQEFILAIEGMFRKIVTDENRRYFVFLLGQTLCLYYNHINGYHNKDLLIVKNKETNENDLLVKSNLDISENNIDLKNFIERFFVSFDYSDVGLNHLLSRISLLENIKIQK